MNESRKKERLKYRQETVEGRQVKIKLAESLKDYEVNVGLLREHSAFIAKAFDEKTGMKEAAEGYIILPDVTSEILETFIYWIYNRIIVLPDGSDGDDLDGPNCLTFVELYTFADLYDTRELRNHVVKAFLRVFCNEKGYDLDFKIVGAALHKLPQTSKLCDVFLAAAHTDLDLKDEDDCEALSMHFPREAIRILINANATGGMEDLDLEDTETWLEKDEL